MGFTYEYYAHLIELLRKKGFVFQLFRDPSPATKRVFLRHDIDMSIDDALDFARVEEHAGVSSTYFVMLDTQLYNVLATKSISKLKDILDLGHDVGLHYVQRDENYESPGYDAALVNQIRHQIKILGEILDLEIGSFSYHRPHQLLLEKRIIVARAANAYMDPFFVPNGYISDSNHHWRCGDPALFIENFNADTLQVLTHPFWWGMQSVDPAKKLQTYLHRLTQAHKATLVQDVKLARSAFSGS